MFVFGRGVGVIETAFTAAGYSPQEVPAANWQKALGVVPRARRREGKKLIWLETRSQFKGRLKAMAQSMFPSVKVTLAVSDALLIAAYCRRHTG